MALIRLRVFGSFSSGWHPAQPGRKDAPRPFGGWSACSRDGPPRLILMPLGSVPRFLLARRKLGSHEVVPGTLRAADGAAQSARVLPQSSLGCSVLNAPVSLVGRSEVASIRWDGRAGHTLTADSPRRHSRHVQSLGHSGGCRMPGGNTGRSRTGPYAQKTPPQ